MSHSVGELKVSSTKRAEYSASFAAFSPAANPTYIFSLPGIFNSLKVVTILRLGISMTFAGADALGEIQLQKLSSDLTGGTRLPGVAVKLDSNSTGNNGFAGRYSANPTGGGALVGIIRSVKFKVSGTATSASAQQGEYIFDFTSKYSKGLVLRGTSEVLALTLLGADYSLSSANFWIEWIEV